MTKEEINQLGHAFFNGKTLQYQSYNQEWYDWLPARCPDFKECGWRIKPGVPKTITICTLIHEGGGNVEYAIHGSYRYENLTKTNQWTHIKSLDQVVEVE